jgi:hypothetical protein
LVDVLTAEEGWVDEIAAQPLTEEQGANELRMLRDAIRAADQTIDAEDSILREQMISLLVRSKPATWDEWLRNIPVDYRLATNGDHVLTHLSKILEITARLQR